MKKEKKGLLLQTTKELNTGTTVAAIGFGLYLAAGYFGFLLAADLIAVAFTVVAAWTFWSAANLREKDKAAVSYNLLWGSGALTLLLGACAVLAIRQRLGL